MSEHVPHTNAANPAPLCAQDWPATPRAARDRALRVALVADGSILEERLIPRRGVVTIGDSEASTTTGSSVRSSRSSARPAPSAVGRDAERASDACRARRCRDRRARVDSERHARDVYASIEPVRRADERRACTRIESELAHLNAQMIGALGGGPATDNVVHGGDVPMSALEMAARSEAGSGRGDPAGLRLGGSGGTVRPGAGSSLSQVGELGARAPESAGGHQHLKGPVSVRTEGITTTGGGAGSDAAAVIARVRGGFRACYQRGLDDDPTMRGRVALVARIAPNGDVATVSDSGRTGLSASVVACLSPAMQSAAFAPP